MPRVRVRRAARHDIGVYGIETGRALGRFLARPRSSTARGDDERRCRRCFPAMRRAAPRLARCVAAANQRRGRRARPRRRARRRARASPPRAANLTDWGPFGSLATTRGPRRLLRRRRADDAAAAAGRNAARPASDAQAGDPRVAARSPGGGGAPRPRPSPRRRAMVTARPEASRSVRSRDEIRLARGAPGVRAVKSHMCEPERPSMVLADAYYRGDIFAPIRIGAPDYVRRRGGEYARVPPLSRG